MKNKDLWLASKFIKQEKGFQVSDNLDYVSYGSRFIASIQVKIYQELIQRNAKGLLLDLGCGNVPLYEMYKDYISDSICVDWGNSYNRNIYLDYEVDLNLENLPLKSEMFDTVLLTDVLEHIANPYQLMKEVARLLKPDGRLILTAPFLYWIHEVPYDYFRYTEYSLKHLCDKNSLNILTVEPYGGAPEVIIDIISKNISKFPMTSTIFSKLSKFFISTHVGKGLSEKTCRYFPLGYSLVAEKCNI